MKKQDVYAYIRATLGQLGKHAIDVSRLSDDANLYDAGLKSLGVVRLLLAIEDRFEIELPEVMLRRDLFNSVASIGDAVCAMISTEVTA